MGRPRAERVKVRYLGEDEVPAGSITAWQFLGKVAGATANSREQHGYF